MTTFALDVNSSEGDIIAGLNYALANLSDNTNLLQANVLVANITTGEISTTSTNSSGYSSTTIVSYLYQYMNVKYANSATGGSGFSANSTLSNYFGVHNTSSGNISNNPTDYQWTQVTGGFGTTKSLWYQTIGGRQIAFFAGNTAPQPDFITVPDNTVLDLDTITAAQNNQVIIVSAYYQANTTPATPSGGSYDFTTLTLTAPTGWSATIPGLVANTSIYISQTSFVGNTASTSVSPSTNWTVPVVFNEQFQGNAGPPGQRGFLPMGFVLTASDPTLFSNANLTTAFSSSRSNPSPPIGLGFSPIQYDTAQFAYTDLFSGDTITVVKQYDGSGWLDVDGQVISGDLFIPGSINANTLNVNQVYALTIQSTNANLGNVSSAGYWFQANTGDARIGGNINIGNFLTVGQNAQIGANLIVGNNTSIGNNLSVGTNANISNNLTVGNNTTIGTNITIGANGVIGANLSIGNNASIGNNLNVGANAVIGNNLIVGTNANIGNNLTIGNNSVIGGNLSVTGLITQGSLANAVVTTNNLVDGSITGVKIQNGTITGNLIAANTIQGNSIVANSITGSQIAAQTITSDKLAANLIISGDIVSYNATLGNVDSAGYWLQANTGSARFGGNLSIGNIITASNINTNTITTNMLVVNSATQTISQSNNQNYPQINFINGASNNPASADFLWPWWTRGFAIGGGVTLTTTTNGSISGSKIMVNYNAYINSATNSTYNLVELWKSGSSKYYAKTFHAVRTEVSQFNNNPTTLANIDLFIIPGENGSYYWGNIGNIQSQITGTNAFLYDGYSQFASTPNSNYNDNLSGIGAGGAFVIGVGTGSSPFAGNIGYYSSNAGYTNPAYPLFDMYGTSFLTMRNGATETYPQIIVGSGGRIAFRNQQAGAGSPFAKIWNFENSGTFADLQDISADFGGWWNVTTGTTINYVAVGSGGTILYNSRSYTTGGNVNASTGWTQASSPTIKNLNAVIGNYVITSGGAFDTNLGTRANTWVAVGDQGTILRSSSYSGPWLQANTVPTTNNLYGVGYTQGYWCAVGAAGTVLYSTDADTWYPAVNNADGHIATIAARDLYGVAGGAISGRWVMAGQEIIMNTDSLNPGTAGYANVYLGGTSVNSTLTRLQYFGSWANVANVSQPPITQRVTNGQNVSGTYIDTNYVEGDTITYYLVLGNMAGNVNIITNGPNMTVTEFKR